MGVTYSTRARLAESKSLKKVNSEHFIPSMFRRTRIYQPQFIVVLMVIDISTNLT